LPALRLAACAQQVLQRLSLDDLLRGAPGTEARHHEAVRVSQGWRVRVADQIQAVAFG
jgi:hypothetical protein